MLGTRFRFSKQVFTWKSAGHSKSLASTNQPLTFPTRWHQKTETADEVEKGRWGIELTRALHIILHRNDVYIIQGRGEVYTILFQLNTNSTNESLQCFGNIFFQHLYSGRYPVFLSKSLNLVFLSHSGHTQLHHLANMETKQLICLFLLQ